MTISTMLVTCKQCGRQYEPTREAIVAGTWRRGCPVCHPPGGQEKKPHGD